MKFLYAILLLGFASPAFADSFGSRFDNRTPSALDGPAEKIEDIAPADIEPAAGSVEDTQETDPTLISEEAEEKIPADLPFEK